MTVAAPGDKCPVDPGTGNLLLRPAIGNQSAVFKAFIPGKGRHDTAKGGECKIISVIGATGICCVSPDMIEGTGR